MEYNFREIEDKWQRYWRENKSYKSEIVSGKKKYYVLDMFPYPSGAGLHVGHPLGYIASDIVSRYKKLRGFNVLHPMGYDAFGLPAEQYAIQTGQHPKITTEQNIARYREQLDRIGFCFDWSREIRTCEPEYYKWTQWVFIKLFNSWFNCATKKAESIDELIAVFSTKGFNCSEPQYLTGDIEKAVAPFSSDEWNAKSEMEKSDILLNFRLAYLSNAMVNWCPALGTVLANDEVKDGVSERGGFPVEKKIMKQWSLRITAYADRLLTDLDELDWPDSVKEAQRNWIGKSEGTSIRFEVIPNEESNDQADQNSIYNAASPDTKELKDHRYSDPKSYSHLKKFSRENKLNPTEAEEVLWEALRRTSLGFKFRRQYPISKYIPDFVCLDPKLVIEVDGGIHMEFSQRENDANKNAELNFYGFEVLRFKNEEILDDIENVLIVISNRLNELKNNSPSPLERGLGGEASTLESRDFSSESTEQNSSDFKNDSSHKVQASPQPSPAERELVGDSNPRISQSLSDFKNDSSHSNPPSPLERGLGGEASTLGNRETLYIEVFTTRPDTVFGVSFVALAPEHDLVNIITSAEYRSAVQEYVEASSKKSERERQTEVKKVSGQFTGAYVAHPFTGAKIPVWIGEYVLVGYGTGAVMAVPGHDQRDYLFAKHFNLPIQEVVSGGDLAQEAYVAKEGVLVNSDFLNGLDVKAAVKKAIGEIEKRGIGKGQVNYRLRDAAFGRQRYWGEPIPIFYEDGIPKTISETDLPLVLPEIDKFQPTESGEPPLARAADWKYKGKFNYETTTMPGWAGSSWYFLRYMDSNNEKEFVSKEAVNYWQQVDFYLGGAEHATGHLLYVRFWTKFLYDLNLIPCKEPAKKLINQGMIQGVSAFVYRINGSNKFVSEGLKNQYETTALHVDISIAPNHILDTEKFKLWREDFKNAEFILEGDQYKCGAEVEKMSKSKYNVVNPDDIIEEYGADTLRLYEMFLGPLEQSKPWSTQGISGVHNFLRRAWRLFQIENGACKLSDETPSAAELKVLHKTIKKVEEDVERFSFNTTISAFMICLNELSDLKCNKRQILEPFTILLSPYAPHFAEELWSLLGHKESITKASFPIWKEEYLVENEFEYPISINGKVKFKINLSLQLSKEEVEKNVMSSEELGKFMQGTPKKIIVVPGRIVNIVV